MAFPRSYQAGQIMKMLWGFLVFSFLKPYLLPPANHTPVIGGLLLFISILPEHCPLKGLIKSLLKEMPGLIVWKAQVYIFPLKSHPGPFNLFTYKQNALYCIECSFDRWLLAFYPGVKITKINEFVLCFTHFMTFIST